MRSRSSKSSTGRRAMSPAGSAASPWCRPVSAARSGRLTYRPGFSTRPRPISWRPSKPSAASWGRAPVKHWRPRLPWGSFARARASTRRRRACWPAWRRSRPLSWARTPPRPPQLAAGSPRLGFAPTDRRTRRHSSAVWPRHERGPRGPMTRPWSSSCKASAIPCWCWPGTTKRARPSRTPSNACAT